MTKFTVHKCDEKGNTLLTYTGKLIKRGETWICLQAIFMLNTIPIGTIILEKGDLMTEWFYTDRYYNVFRLENENGLKGWYCNIARPAHITEDSISSDDLALDVVVNANYEVTLLDEAEFNALCLSNHERQSALSAVETIYTLITRQEPPFSPNLH